jgi:hypothetical protein
MLLYHISQKSVSDVLKKLLAISHSDYEGELAVAIREKQYAVLERLIDKLRPI